jgi:hypothetical protein
MPRYGTPDREYGMRLATCPEDEDGPIYMLNLMKYRERADYAGDAPAEHGVTGREADELYSPVDVLAEIGAAPVFMGDVLSSSEDWDRVAVVRYATRRSFIEMQTRDDFKEKHVHKDAGMDHTIVMGTLPRDGVPSRTKPNRVLLEVWDGDGPPDRAGGVAFDVEGTILGDGRSWSAVRWTPLADGDDVPAGGDGHQVLVVQPAIDRWS